MRSLKEELKNKDTKIDDLKVQNDNLLEEVPAPQKIKAR